MTKPAEHQGSSRKLTYNSQFLFDGPVELPPKKQKIKKAKEKRLTFFTATSAIMLGTGTKLPN
jgi:hypothetical protein